MRVMVVDDDQAILQGLSHIIRKAAENMEIVTAPDGIEALEKLKGIGADLLITDISMPGISGLDLIRKSQSYGFCSRFVILTGYEEFEFARQAIKYHVKDYLLKPVDREELLSAVRKVESELSGEKTGKQLHRLPVLENCRLDVAPVECNPKMQKILEYIGNNYRLDLSLDRIGEIFNLHPNYICALFKNELNLTFHRYLNILRVRNSAEMLLADGDAAISDIASASGFMTERQFYKIFKKYVSLTPGEFRRRYGEER